MGTSGSSSGPGGGVPLVPPWVPDVGTPAGIAKQDGSVPLQGGAATAPTARFGGARRSLGEFAKAGEGSSLRSGLASYVGRGLGGSANATKRMGGAASRAGALFDVLHSLGGSRADSAALGLDLGTLAGRPANEIIDNLSRLVSPVDGTQDSESSQRAVNAALSDLLDEDDTADIGALSEKQIEWVLERYIVYEINNRIELDIGKAVLEKAPTASAAIERLDEIRGYVQETVAAAFRARRKAGKIIDRSGATKLAVEVIHDTFKVFEEYVQ